MCQVDPALGTLTLMANGKAHAHATIVPAPCIPIPPPSLLLMPSLPSPLMAVSSPCVQTTTQEAASHTADVEATLQLGSLFTSTAPTHVPLLSRAEAVRMDNGVPAWSKDGGPLMRGVVLGAQKPSETALPATTHLPAVRMRQQAPLPGGDAIERVVSQLVADLTGAPVARDAPLLAAGLDSLAAVELPGQLSAHFNLPLDATLVIDHPTVHAIVQHVRERLTTVEVPVPTNLVVQTKGRAVAILKSAGARNGMLFLVVSRGSMCRCEEKTGSFRVVLTGNDVQQAGTMAWLRWRRIRPSRSPFHDGMCQGPTWSAACALGSLPRCLKTSRALIPRRLGSRMQVAGGWSCVF